MLSGRRPDRLFHWTCDHGAVGIGRDGHLRPLEMLNPNAAAIMGPEEAWRTALIWATDLEHLPDRESLGLTFYHLMCDRSAYRIEIDPAFLGVASWWPSWCAEGIRSGRLPESARALSFAPGARPAHWYVLRAPVPVL